MVKEDLPRSPKWVPRTKERTWLLLGLYLEGLGASGRVPVFARRWNMTNIPHTGENLARFLTLARSLNATTTHETKALRGCLGWLGSCSQNATTSQETKTLRGYLGWLGSYSLNATATYETGTWRGHSGSLGPPSLKATTTSESGNWCRWYGGLKQEHSRPLCTCV